MELKKKNGTTEISSNPKKLLSITYGRRSWNK